MQKIITREERDRKRQRNMILIGVILVGIMIISTAGFAINFGSRNDDSSSIKSQTFNGVRFVNNGEYWIFNIGETQFATLNNPNDTSNIKFFNKFTIENYKQKPLYFVGDTGIGFTEIARNIQNYPLRIQRACIIEKECKEDLPIKNCSNDNIIVIEEPRNNGSEGIIQEENCVYITAYYSNQSKYADAFLYGILGVR